MEECRLRSPVPLAVSMEHPRPMNPHPALRDSRTGHPRDQDDLPRTGDDCPASTRCRASCVFVSSCTHCHGCPADDPTHPAFRLGDSAATRSAPPPTTSRPDPRLGLVGREQAEHEARAKAMWGDPPEQIASYLMVQGYEREEAMELTQALVKERTSAVRANGIRKAITGFALMWVPVIAFIVFLAAHFMPLKIMGAAILVGVYGAYLLIRGVLMAVAPKSEKGDVADQ